MKWFFAVDQYSPHFASYVEMTKVAVWTARRVTTLEPHCLFDGDMDHDLAHWLRSQGVMVWSRRTPFWEGLKKLSDEQKDANILSFGAGTFLRLEIPRLAKEQRWSDEFALYTDTDVMFLRDPVPELEQLKPRWFVVAPEGDESDLENVNAGVMLINIPAMSAIDDDLHSFGHRHLSNFVDYHLGNAFDQALFRSYFRPLTRFLVERGVPVPLERAPGYRLIWGRFYYRTRQLLDKPRWQRLPLKFNWKARNADEKGEAHILHFHGPKPNEKRLETAPQALSERDNPALQELLPMLRTPAFYEFAREWERALSSIQGDAK